MNLKNIPPGIKRNDQLALTLFIKTGETVLVSRVIGHLKEDDVE